MIFQPMGWVLAAGAWPFVVYTNRMVELLARVPGGNLNVGEIALIWIGLYYLVVLGLTFLPAARLVLRKRISLAAPAAVVCILGIVVWRAYFLAPDGQLHITFLDVGTGEAIYIQSPEGRRILLNGGPSMSRLTDALGRRMPLNDRALDFLVVSGGESAQLGALPRLIDRVPPDNVLWVGPTFASPSARALQQGLVAAEIPVIQAQTGQALDLGKGIRLKVLAVGSRGAVFLLEWGHFKLLLPLGIMLDMMDALEGGQAVGPVTALLLADNGYAPSNPPEWLGALQPQLAVLSVGAGDPQGLPDSELLESVKDYSLLRTDRNGWIELTTDGEQLEVEVERR
jgi:competence protein ComEC